MSEQSSEADNEYIRRMEQAAIHRMNKRALVHQSDFHRIFGVDVREFVNAGFDVIKFDDWLQAGDRSVEDVVREKYGDEAAELIWKML